MLFLLLIVLTFLWLESVVITLPLFLIAISVVLVFHSARGNNLVFVLAFLGGLILDMSAVRSLGVSSLFLICWLFFISLYERKYEINTIIFVVASSFFGSFFYLLFFGYGDSFIQSVVSSFLGGVLYFVFGHRSFFQKEKLRFRDL